MKITRDWLASQYEGGVCYLPSALRVVDDCPFMRTLRTHLRRAGLSATADSISLIHYVRSGRYVLSHWIFRPGEGNGPGLLKSIEVLGTTHPDRQDPDCRGVAAAPRIDYLVERLRPAAAQMAAIRRQMAEEAYDRDMIERCNDEERAEYVQHLARKYGNKHPFPDGVRRGVLPYSGSLQSPLLRQIARERLTGITNARHRLISVHGVRPRSTPRRLQRGR